MKKPSKAKNLFKGKESNKEELAEAKAIKSGKLTPKQYAAGEKSEGKAYKKGGKTKCFADGGRARMGEDGDYSMGEDGDYSMGRPPSISEAMSDNDDRLGGRNASMTLPGQTRPANRQATGGSGYKPYAGTVDKSTPTPAAKVQTGMSLDEAKAGKKAAPAPVKKPVVKKAAPVPTKRAASKPSGIGGISAADLEAFRQENMADREAYGMKKGGKVKPGNVRGHGAERSGRTKGRFI